MPTLRELFLTALKAGYPDVEPPTTLRLTHGRRGRLGVSWSYATLQWGQGYTHSTSARLDDSVVKSLIAEHGGVGGDKEKQQLAMAMALATQLVPSYVSHVKVEQARLAEKESRRKAAAVQHAERKADKMAKLAAVGLDKLPGRVELPGSSLAMHVEGFDGENVELYMQTSIPLKQLMELCAQGHLTLSGERESW